MFSPDELKDMCSTTSRSSYCCVCKFMFTSKVAFLKHRLQHLDVDFQCEPCARTFSFVEYQDHMLGHAEEQEGNCSLCGFRKCYRLGRLDTAVCLRQHKCIYSVNSTPEGEPMASCVLCDEKSFKIGPTTQIHAHLHKAARLYPCPKCDMAFCARADRLLHKIEVHVNRRLKKSPSMSCKVCGRVLHGLKNIKLHDQRCSTIVRTPICRGCNKKFPTASLLHSHLRRIHKIKFFCKKCFELFEKRKELVQHMNTIHKNDTFSEALVCNECGRECKSMRSLIVHMRTIHPKSEISDKSINLLKNCPFCKEDPDDMRQHLNSEHKVLLSSEGLNTTPKLSSKGLNSTPKVSSEGLNTTPKVSSKGLNTTPKVSSKGFNTTPKVLPRRKNWKCYICGRDCKNFYNIVKHYHGSHSGSSVPSHIFTQPPTSTCPICRRKLTKETMGSHFTSVHMMTPDVDCALCKRLERSWHNLVLHVHYKHKGENAPKAVHNVTKKQRCPICRILSEDIHEHLTEIHGFRFDALLLNSSSRKQEEDHVTSNIQQMPYQSSSTAVIHAINTSDISEATEFAVEMSETLTDMEVDIAIDIVIDRAINTQLGMVFEAIIDGLVNTTAEKEVDTSIGAESDNVVGSSSIATPEADEKLDCFGKALDNADENTAEDELCKSGSDEVVGPSLTFAAEADVPVNDELDEAAVENEMDSAAENELITEPGEVSSYFTATGETDVPVDNEFDTAAMENEIDTAAENEMDTAVENEMDTAAENEMDTAAENEMDTAAENELDTGAEDVVGPSLTITDLADVPVDNELDSAVGNKLDLASENQVY